MNPNFNWAIVAERMQSLQAEAQAEADAAARRAAARHAGRVGRARRPRSRWGLALAAAALSRRTGSTARGITIKAGEAL